MKITTDEMYELLTAENKEIVNAEIRRLLQEQDSANTAE